MIIRRTELVRNRRGFRWDWRKSCEARVFGDAAGGGAGLAGVGESVAGEIAKPFCAGCGFDGFGEGGEGDEDFHIPMIGGDACGRFQALEIPAKILALGVGDDVAGVMIRW